VAEAIARAVGGGVTDLVAIGSPGRSEPASVIRGGVSKRVAAGLDRGDPPVLLARPATAPVPVT
jgi:hypothetical protein